MLIVYEIATLSIVSISGVRPMGRFVSDEEKGVALVDPPLPGQAEYRVTDEATIDKIWASVDAGATVELVSDGKGNVVGVRPYKPIAASASPIPASVNAVVEVTATLPADTPDAEVTFVVDGGAPVTEPVAQGTATHAYAFTAPGIYRITVSSQHHGAAVVEVTVQ